MADNAEIRESAGMAGGASLCGCAGTAGARDGTGGNRPGLPALALRVGGRYGEVMARMRARLPRQEVPPGDPAGHAPLAPWTPPPDAAAPGEAAATGDPADALLDAAATGLDVLSFYGERIANEGYLRTATERRSLLELARTIGYELRPGAAAAAWLAFQLEDADGAPGPATVPAGTPVQSIPAAPGERPQTFETSMALEVRAEWNALRPLSLSDQPLTTTASTLFLAGTGLRLTVGDVLLIVAPAKPPAAAPGGAAGETPPPPPDTRVVVITAVEEQPALQRTRVDVANPAAVPPPAPTPAPPLVFARVSLTRVALTQANVGKLIVAKAWRERDLDTFLEVQRWDIRKVVQHVNRGNVHRGDTELVVSSTALPDAELGVFAFRDALGVFGHNAPRWDSLPAAQRYGEWVQVKDSATPPGKKDQFVEPTYPALGWDSGAGPAVTVDSRGTSYAATGDVFFLERTVRTLRPNSWLVLTGTAAAKPYRVSAVTERSLSDFALTAKATGVRVADKTGLDSFTMRGTTAHVDAEPLPLAPLPITTPLGAGDTSLPLDRLVLGLRPGRPVMLSGERVDLPGVTEHEVLFLDDAVHVSGRTTLLFTTGLRWSYVRSTVTVNANVVLATHGETVAESLGAGDGAARHQAFGLRRPPLTYVSADTPTGVRSTLEVRVDGILWEESPQLYSLAPNARRYIVRRTDEGAVSIIGGDGNRGARFPSGLVNITATYRSGIGLVGQVGPDQLTLLPRRPLGVRSVTNPLAASGAADPESRDDARANAPMTVRTIDRVVSLRDYADFATTFAGIGKAQVTALRKGAVRLVHLTVAAADGTVIPPESPLAGSIVAALRRHGDPSQRVTVDGFDPRFFRLAARLRLDTPTHVAADVLAAARAAVRAAFSFPRRQFAQPVTRAEVTALLQSVPGVVSVDVDVLHVIADDVEDTRVDEVLPAQPARWLDPRPERGDDTVLRAELLLVSPADLELTERTSVS